MAVKNNISDFTEASLEHHLATLARHDQQTGSDLPAQSHNEVHTVLQRHSSPPNNTHTHTHAHRLRKSLTLWSWSCVQVNAHAGECYLQILGSADIQAGDVLDPLIDLIHNRMLKRSKPGADGQDRMSNQFNPNHRSRGAR